MFKGEVMEPQKKITCRIRDGRIDFSCPECKKRHMSVIRPNEKSRTIACKGCGVKTLCCFNRRRTRRELQSGKGWLDIGNAQHIMISLRDLSDDGVGFDIPRGHTLTKGQELIGITCDWNKRFPRYRLVVCTVMGQKIGARFIRDA